MRPPTPERTPSPTHVDKGDSSSSHQRKRQRTDSGSASSLSRNCSTEPLTPPRSSQASPVPRSPSPPVPGKSVANFDCLPPDIKQRIILDAIDSFASTPPPRAEYRWVEIDPRMPNTVLHRHLHRHRLFALYSGVSRFWYACLQPLLRRGPRMVVSAEELSKLAGNEHEIPGKTVCRPGSNSDGYYNAWEMEGRVRDAWQPKREKIKKSTAPEIEEIFCWMTSLPWRKDNSEIMQRWPRWYLLDNMRYDLEDLHVKKLALVAGQQATLADALNATIPNSSRITHLHLEVHHPAAAVRPCNDKFENIYRHCPDSRHLCPRLLMHKDTLESLSFRNVACCSLLQPSQFRNLKSFYMFWINNWPGLCYDHYNSSMNPDKRDARREVEELRWEMAKLIERKPQARVLACAGYDRMIQNGDWMADYSSLVDSDRRCPIQSDNIWWELLIAGSLPIPLDDEEDYSEYEPDWEEEEEEEIMEEDEDDTDEEKGAGRVTATSAIGRERKIAPAPVPQTLAPAHRPLRIR